MITLDGDLQEHLMKPFEVARATGPTMEDKQRQKPKVLTISVIQAPAKEHVKVGKPAKQPTSTRRERGIFERVKGSGIWWIRYADANGKERREKAGTKGMAIKLYQKRKTEALQGKKLPETIRRRPVLVSELLRQAAEYIRARYRGLRLGSDGYDYRHAPLKEALGNRPADSVTASDIERVLSRLAEKRRWKPASFNRHKAFLSLAWRLAVESNKLTVNPVRLVHRRREDNDRIRWLSSDEEIKLRTVIEASYPNELPAFDLALHTGMRKSEQYGLTWDCVDIERRQITIPRSKNGKVRYIPLDNTALNALLQLRTRSDGTGQVMVSAKSGHGYLAGHGLRSPREWLMPPAGRPGSQTSHGLVFGIRSQAAW